MVRGLAQWTKTLSFPSRISSNRNSKDCSNTNIHQITPLPPIPTTTSCKNKAKNQLSPTTQRKNMPITEISQIIYSEPDSEKSITETMALCIHHKQGCKWSDELKNLKAHLNTCKYDALLCPRKCGSRIPKIMMTDHLTYTCPQRRTRCEFCQVEFSGQELEEHFGSCAQEPIYCESKCGMKLLRGRMSIHRSKECLKRLKRCPHCHREFSADTLELHKTNCPRLPIPCPHRCTASPIAKSDLEAHLREDCKTVAIACTFKEAGCRFKGSRHHLETHLEANTSAHLSLMVAMASRQAQQIQILKNTVSKMSTNYTGTLLWKITDWSAKMAEAKSKDGIELVSPPFFTSLYGYKLQASMFLNGNGPGEGTHVSVYIKVLPGEYDALLRWPFPHPITFTIFEQGIKNGQGGIAESFVPDPSWENFQRPSLEPDQLGFGFPRFISHELLYSRPFIKDDVVFLRVKVDPSKAVSI